jgi:hypothetical protein
MLSAGGVPNAVSLLVSHGDARISWITHARSDIAARQAWNGTSALPDSITPAQTIAVFTIWAGTKVSNAFPASGCLSRERVKRKDAKAR